MKKVINGKTYNTETATWLGNRGTDHLSTNDFNYIDESLYMTKKGRYFLAGFGGARTHYAYEYNGSYGASSKILPLTKELAKLWAATHLEEEEYKDIFKETIPKELKDEAEYYKEYENRLTEKLWQY